MNYGYFNAFITDIGEDVPTKAEELHQYADDVRIETISARPLLNDLIDNVIKPGDKIYVYSFSRFCSGLSDLDSLLAEIIDEKQAVLISLHDDFDSSTEAGKGARKAFHQAVSLITADPSHGFYR